jgi:hypothetical protein
MGLLDGVDSFDLLLSQPRLECLPTAFSFSRTGNRPQLNVQHKRIRLRESLLREGPSAPVILSPTIKAFERKQKVAIRGTPSFGQSCESSFESCQCGFGGKREHDVAVFLTYYFYSRTDVQKLRWIQRRIELQLY